MNRQQTHSSFSNIKITKHMKHQNQPSALQDAKWRQVTLPEPTLIQVKGGGVPQGAQAPMKED